MCAAVPVSAVRRHQTGCHNIHLQRAGPRRGETLTDFAIGRCSLVQRPSLLAVVLLDALNAVEGLMQVPYTARASIHDVVATRERSRIRGGTIPMSVRAAIVPNRTDRIVAGRSAFAHHTYE